MVSSAARGATGMTAMMTAMREHCGTTAIDRGMVHCLASQEESRRTLGTDALLVYAEHSAGSRGDLTIAVPIDCQIRSFSTPDRPRHVRLLPILGAHVWLSNLIAAFI